MYRMRQSGPAARAYRDNMLRSGEHVHHTHPEGDEHCHGGDGADQCAQWGRQLEEWRNLHG